MFEIHISIYKFKCTIYSDTLIHDTKCYFQCVLDRKPKRHFSLFCQEWIMYVISQRILQSIFWDLRFFFKKELFKMVPLFYTEIKWPACILFCDKFWALWNHINNPWVAHWTGLSGINKNLNCVQCLQPSSHSRWAFNTFSKSRAYQDRFWVKKQGWAHAQSGVNARQCTHASCSK